MTLTTPIYGLPYPAQGQPIRDTRLILENLAKLVEAALQNGGIAPAGAADIAALAGRVATLEAGRARATLYATAPQGGLVSWATINLYGETTDSANGHVTGGSPAAGYTIPAGQGGDWLVSAQVPLVPGAAGNAALRVMKNGSTNANVALPIGHGEYLSVGTSGGTVSLAPRILPFAAGDVITLQALAAGTWSTQADTTVGGLTSSLTLLRVG